MLATDLERDVPFARAIAGLPLGDDDPGVMAEPLPIPGVATVQARRGRGAALREAAAASLGLRLPTGPAVSAGGGFVAVGSGPGVWLVLAADRSEADPVESLAAALGAVAAVTDQSGAYAGLRLVGPRVPDLLAKGAFLDLSEDTFPPASAATTQLAHFSVVLWRDPVGDHFNLLCFRSYADSLWGWLTAAAAEFGLVRRG